MMRTQRLAHRHALAALASAAAITIAGAFLLDTGSALAQAQAAQQQVSGNWSGYVVRSSAGNSFSSVSGSWVQPPVSASSGQGYAAFWVGLDGADEQSQSLEQVGTAAQVVDGKISYYGWYELVPAGQQALNLTVHPGDHMSGKVTVDGSSVTVSLSDETTGASAQRTLHMTSPDTSSAEWIAEAPAAQYPDGTTQVLPLANFGRVTFTQASATAAGHTGSISDPAWTVDQVQLSSGSTTDVVGGGGAVGVDVVGAAQQSAGASASGLSSSGSSFTVSYSPGGESTGSDAQSSYSGGYAYSGGYGYPGGDGYPGYAYGYPGDGYWVYGVSVGP